MRLCYTCDTHGYIFPTNFYKKGSDINMGVFKLASQFKKDNNTLIIDGGDTIQGSPLTYYLSKKSAIPLAKCMNRLGYDYITLGNHDFNYGIEYLQEYLENLNAKCICANIYDKERKLPISPYVIHKMPDGTRVGILGLCTHHVSVWEKADTLEKLHIEPPIDAIEKYLPIIKKQSDITICLYHGGLEIDTSTMQVLNDVNDENQGYLIAKNYDFDIVLTAHQHIDFEGFISNSYVVQNTNNALSYVEIDINNNNISSKRIFADKGYDNSIAEDLLPVYNEVESWLDKPLGTLSTELKAYNPLYNAINGSLIANFINQVQIWASNADISACSLANEVKGFSKEVSVRDVLSTYVYSNTLCVLDIDGKTLREYMEHVASYFELDGENIIVSDAFTKPKIAHYNYDYFYNIEYAFDITKKPGSRLMYMKYKSKDILPDDRLSIVINNYRASGTGGFDMLKKLRHIKDIQEEVSMLIIKNLEQNKNFNVDTHIPYKIVKN